jgi:hypothetical protein
MPAGRPSDYTQELADRICAQLSDGKSLRSVCKADDMPSTVTVFSWLRTHEEFLNQYTRAKEESADALTDEMLDIADDVEGDSQRDRLRVDTRKWIASKLKPKKYGDKLEHDVSGGLADLLRAIDGKTRGIPTGS